MTTIEDRFWPKVERRSFFDCWIWRGATAGGLPNQKYGQIVWNGSHRQAHRVAYELLVGPIPTGLVLDHLCRNRTCVNPSHLEPVTLAVNVLRGTGPTANKARQTHCIHGHPFTSDNAIKRTPGWRRCRACQTARDRRRYLERVGSAATV